MNSYIYIDAYVTIAVIAFSRVRVHLGFQASGITAISNLGSSASGFFQMKSEKLTKPMIVIAVQKVEAAFKKAVADHEKFKDSVAKDPQFLQNMQAELQEIDSQILELEQYR